MTIVNFLPDHAGELVCTIEGGETFTTFHRSREEADMARDVILGLRAWDSLPNLFGLVVPKGAHVIAAVVRMRRD